MHPVVIIVPAAALIFGPRLWVKHVLKQYDREEEAFPLTAGELARRLLDQQHLHHVKVEMTDIGDHYDHRAKAVRLNRQRINRRTLTAVTTAAHEVAHALQDASRYGPFVWRTRLVKVAQVTVEVGSVMLLAVPVTALVTRRPVPPVVVGSAAISVLGAGVATQLAALPSELDASFARALPLLQEQVIRPGQEKDVRKILAACSLTYVASSLAAVLSLWPWLGRARLPAPLQLHTVGLLAADADGRQSKSKHSRPAMQAGMRPVRARRRKKRGVVEDLVRQVGKPLVRGWFRLVYDR
jgi:Zn-dependent membrane protease YugP